MFSLNSGPHPIGKDWTLLWLLLMLRTPRGLRELSLTALLLLDDVATRDYNELAVEWVPHPKQWGAAGWKKTFNTTHIKQLEHLFSFSLGFTSKLKEFIFPLAKLMNSANRNLIWQSRTPCSNILY